MKIRCERKSVVVYISVFFGLLALDRVTKFLALKYLQSEISISSFMNLNFSWNRGVSWGLMNDVSHMGFWLLAAFIASVIILFFKYTIRQYREGEPVLFEIFVLAGALSNFFDRLYYGAVIDFIDVFIATWHWPTFNIADGCIVLGIGGIIGRGLVWVVQKK